jgi:trk system potassium uptake protein TrkH
MDGKAMTHDVIRAANIFLILYIVVFVGSQLLITLDNYDLITNFTAVAATLNNIGPGLELVGPTANFDIYSYPSKCVLIFDMLAGRLELFPLLILFSRDTWKKF